MIILDHYAFCRQNSKLSNLLLVPNKVVECLVLSDFVFSE